MVTWTKHAEDTTIAVAHGDVLVAEGGCERLWHFSLVLSGDLACYAWACHIVEDTPLHPISVRVNFENLDEMKRNIEAAFLDEPVPRAVAAAMTTAVPDFIADSEVAYETDRYVYRPD